MRRSDLTAPATPPLSVTAAGSASKRTMAHGCDQHEVITPSREQSRPIAEGHVDLVRGSCAMCGLTVVGLDTGTDTGMGRPVEWTAVGDMVRRARRYPQAPLDSGSIKAHTTQGAQFGQRH